MMGQYNRDISYRKAKSRKAKSENINSYFLTKYGWHQYNNLHEYSKNKIHCSCMDCSPKTNNKGDRRCKKGNYAPSKNWKINDKRKLNSLSDSKIEFFSEEELCQN